MSSVAEQATPTNVAEGEAVVPEATTLAEVSRHHTARAQLLKERNEASYKQMCASATAASTALVEQTNKDALNVFNQEQQIESQIKELMSETERFQKQLHQWGMMFSRFDTALKEVGDLTNWSTMIEQDVQDCVTILDEVSRKKRQQMGLE